MNFRLSPSCQFFFHYEVTRIARVYKHAATNDNSLDLDPFNRKLAFVGIIPNQLFSLSSDKLISRISFQPVQFDKYVFPAEWKHAVVVPIFKQRGSRSDPSNHRPVSLLHPIGKVFDAIQCNSFPSFLQENDIISKHQFGFLTERSTTMQLVFIIEQWLRGMETGHMTTAVFMDFKKAFDKVWHRGLLYKLTTAGVSLSKCLLAFRLPLISDNCC